MHSFEVEETKKVGNDWVLDISVLPNRSHDCFSHQGVAGECSALLKSDFPEIKEKVLEDKKLKSKNFIGVRVEDPDLCPRYSARVVTGIKVGASPYWIQKRLEACGLRPINNIVDITNYVMLELGQPLHAFDQEKIGGRKIVVRRAKKGEKITSLDEIEYELNEEILVIADETKPVAIAGIKGGKGPEIDGKTKTVVIESANFKPSNIRITSKKLNLRTDASIRFEHGIDPNLTEVAVNRAVKLIREIAGGMITQGLVDAYPKKIVSRKVALSLEYTEKFLGVKITEKEIKNILNSLGIKYKNKNKEGFLVFEIPTRRIDIVLQEDLIEEIGRIHGYEKIPAILPSAPIISPKKNDGVFWQDFCRNQFKELGMTEVYNYSFIGEKDSDDFGYAINDLVEIENPMSPDLKYLRPDLIVNLLKDVQRNQNYFDDIKIFEIGKVFKNTNSGIIEKMMVSGLATGESFFELKGIVDSVLNNLGIKKIDYRPDKSDAGKYWHSNIRAEIGTKNEHLGVLGEMSSGISAILKIPKKITVFELDLKKLAKFASDNKEFVPISRFPAVLRDLAVLIPKTILAEEVIEKILTSGGKIIRNIDLFDVYEGKELPEGKKNFAFHISYQADDKTLTSNDVDEIQNKVIKALEENPDWQVRKGSNP